MPDQLAEQIKKLAALRHMADSSALEEFDDETEQLILQRFGQDTKHWEAYELAMMGEAETIVNMPQAAQEDATQDLFHKGIEQRRQVLEGCLADLAEAAGRPVAAQPSSSPPKKKKSRTVKRKPRAAKKKGTTTKKKRGAVKKKARPAKKKKRK